MNFESVFRGGYEEECCAPEGINILTLYAWVGIYVFFPGDSEAGEQVKYLACPLLSWSRGFKKFISERFVRVREDRKVEEE